MTSDAICSDIRLRTGGAVASKWTDAGIAVAVPSSDPKLFHWSLIPIDPDSHSRFVDFMVSLHKQDPF